MECISRGSYSRLNVYETCPRRAMYAYVERIPEPPRPPLPDGKEYPNDRGTRVHEEIEHFVKGLKPAPPKEAKHFAPEVLKLRELVASGQAQLEEPWYFDGSWLPTTADKYVYQVRLDASVRLNSESRAVIDFKTGKRFGNEVKHADQAKLYALGTMLKYPDEQWVYAELHYLDHNEMSQIKYSHALKHNLISHYGRRFDTMFADRVFRPKPNAFSCSFCPYKSGTLGRTDIKGTGACRLNP